MTGEFDLIARHFAPLAGPEGLGLKDDAALLRPPTGEELVLTVDANVAGVHFLEDEAPDLAARRLLRSNLSDLAAKGARPLGYLLALALPPEADDAWLAGFAGGLAADQEIYSVRLFGGDTVSTPGPAWASITAIGSVPEGRMLKRGGAKAGDVLYVTGEIGDAYFGLEAARGGLTAISAERRGAMERLYRLPAPPVAFGPALLASGLATAAADVSDGLAADAGHIAKASDLRVEIDAAATPLSDAVGAVLAATPERLGEALTGGDDYQIVFAGAPDAESDLAALGEAHGTQITRIGRMLAADGGPLVVVLDPAGAPMTLARLGYAHR